MSYVLSPKGFLQVGGVVLVLVAVLGYFGPIGPTSDSLIGEYWFFDQAENIAHLVLGVVALGASFLLGGVHQRYLSLLVAVVALVATLWSLIGPIPQGSNLLGAELQNPADTILHIVVALWAFLAFRSKDGGNMGGMSSMPM